MQRRSRQRQWTRQRRQLRLQLQLRQQKQRSGAKRSPRRTTTTSPTAGSNDGRWNLEGRRRRHIHATASRRRQGSQHSASSFASVNYAVVVVGSVKGKSKVDAVGSGHSCVAFAHTSHSRAFCGKDCFPGRASQLGTTSPVAYGGVYLDSFGSVMLSSLSHSTDDCVAVSRLFCGSIGYYYRR